MAMQMTFQERLKTLFDAALEAVKATEDPADIFPRDERSRNRVACVCAVNHLRDELTTQHAPNPVPLDALMAMREFMRKY